MPSPSKGFVEPDEIVDSGVCSGLADVGGSRSCGASSVSLESGEREREEPAPKGILTGEKVRKGGVDAPDFGGCWVAKPAAIAAVRAFIAVVRLEAGDISPIFGLTGAPRSVVTASRGRRRFSLLSFSLL